MKKLSFFIYIFLAYGMNVNAYNLDTTLGKTMIIIGHMGLAAMAPENTLRSCQVALEHAVDMIEIDVHLCKTGELVVIHDETVDRTTNGVGRVSDKTLHELKRLDAGDGEQVPTLGEIIDLIDGRLPLNIELKGPNTAEPVAELIHDYVKSGNHEYENFLVSSFDHYAVKLFGKLCPEVATGAIIYGLPISLAQCAVDCGADVIGASKDYINKALVDDAHRKGLQVFVYTIKNKLDLKDLEGVAVDGVFCDVATSQS